MDPIALTIGQKFEIEKLSRDIDQLNDVDKLQTIAKELLVAWKSQQAASAWIIRQQKGLWNVSDLNLTNRKIKSKSMFLNHQNLI